MKTANGKRMADEVIDSGGVMKWFVAEPHSSQALLLLDRCLRNEVTLYAPDLLTPELGNILWKKRLFQGMSESDAATILNAFPVLPITLLDAGDLLHEAYRIAVDHQRTFMRIKLSLAGGTYRAEMSVKRGQKRTSKVRPFIKRHLV